MSMLSSNLCGGLFIKTLFLLTVYMLCMQAVAAQCSGTLVLSVYIPGLGHQTISQLVVIPEDGYGSAHDKCALFNVL